MRNEDEAADAVQEACLRALRFIGGFRGQHVVNLFIFPTEHANDTLPAKQVRAGYNIIDWTDSGMVYWAVSSLSAAELEKFAPLVREVSSAASIPNR